MSTAVMLLTIVHVGLSLVGIGTGFIVMVGLLGSQRMDRWTAIFLATTLATTVTGYFFPVDHFLPSHGVGIVSLLTLGLAIAARYRFGLVSAWRWLYVIGAVASQYLDVLVLVVQAFGKVPALKALAPTQSEPPFVAVQVVVMAIFVVWGILAVKRFHALPGSLIGRPA